MSHTPGPYLLSGTTVYALEQVGWIKGKPRLRNRFSAHVQGFCSPEELEAVARLFCAAPDLLKELQHLVCLLEPLEREGSLNVPGLATLNGARAAIAKATTPTSVEDARSEAPQK